MTRGLVLAVLAALAGCSAPSGPVPSQAADLAEVLGGESDGFARALEPREFGFPRDHGSHPDYRTEWWYFTGHLSGADDEAFGFQFTLFRSGLPRRTPGQGGGWRARDLWMGHFAVGDFRRGDFWPFERFARGALGLAGASETGFDAWLENWRIVAEDTEQADSPVVLSAEAGDVALRLRLVPERPPVLQGVNGLSQKGAEPGSASYYYSMPRWRAAGSVRVPAGDFEVSGTAWLDREWSTSVLEPGQAGWDWFSLQLDDGSDLMLYAMRRDDGTTDEYSSGTYVAADGTVQPLQRDDFSIEPRGTWTTDDGIEYPAAWTLRVPGAGLELEVAPRIPNQEMRLSFRYWEGAVVATGSLGGMSVGGRGFVELTGYGRPD
ncbi:MAG: carotenoid 1,2-hydratase [Acidobacteria bacterium]|nr:carotenoid 1,2-hydratase [Acidobacteriota bacterium]